MPERDTCEYLPCHFEGQDCTFCFCPFYPCEDTRTKGRLKVDKCNVVWVCDRCDMVHRPEIAEKILRGLEDGKEPDRIWREVIEPCLK